MIKEFSFNFLKNNKIILYVSTLLVLFSMTYIIISFNFNNNFTREIIIDITSNSIKNNILKENLYKQNYKNITFTNYNNGMIIKVSEKVINNKNKNTEDVKRVVLNLDSNVIFNKIDFIEHKIDSILIRNLIISLIFSLIMILLYTGFKFNFNYGLSVVITLLQNIIISLGFISIFKLYFDSIMFMAILTIFCYCLSSILLLFDTIKSNVNLYNDKKTIEEVVNLSINLNFVKIIYAGFFVIILLLPMIFATISVLKNFSIMMIFGILYGMYSSIFIAPRLLLLKKQNNYNNIL